MDKLIRVQFKGRTYWLNYSMAVMFDVTEKFGDVQAALECVQNGTKEKFEDVKWLFLKMAEDGELARREAGYDKQEFLRPEDITLRNLKPYEYTDIVQAVVDAIEYGYYREVLPKEDAEIDLGLAELHQKKTKTGR